MRAPSVSHYAALREELIGVVRRHVLEHGCQPHEAIAALLAGFVSACIASELSADEMHRALAHQLDQLRYTLRVIGESDA